MEKLNKNIFLLIGVIGIILFGVSGFLKTYVDVTLSTIVIGFGAVMVGIGFGRYFRESIIDNDEELKKNMDIEMNDERNMIIRYKAGYQVNSIMLILLSIVTFIFSLLAVDFYIIIVLASLIFIQGLLSVIIHSRFEKSM